MSDTRWRYQNSEPGLWTVGYYDTDGDWQPESDHTSSGAAAKRVHYLNGGSEEDWEGAYVALNRPTLEAIAVLNGVLQSKVHLDRTRIEAARDKLAAAVSAAEDILDAADSEEEE